jgi:3-methylcrotonyl-CoA carboxylase alpha subunit
MAPIRSSLNVRSDEFRRNAETMLGLVSDLREKTASACRGGSDEARLKHLERGKLLARDRVNRLVDPGTALLELSPLAAYGNCVHLFERDCSVQRRHQKVLEEAPAPGMPDLRRQQMGEAAVAAARAVGYSGAGTVEFIADEEGRFYFMEMNTRLQVEHPVTEMITGQDLVEWQLRVSDGERLPLTQAQLSMRGHALEARVYAEDPDKGFLPSTGALVHLAPPAESEHVRVDTGVEQGDEITPYYDPMIAKLIVWDQTRELALQRMLQALAGYRIVGVANNVEFLSRLVASPAFVEADLDTGLIERQAALLFPATTAALPQDAYLVAALATVLHEQEAADAAAARDVEPFSPWHVPDVWRLNSSLERQLIFRHGDQEIIVKIGYRGPHFELTIDGVRTSASGHVAADSRLRLELGGRRLDAAVVAHADKHHVFLDGRHYRLARIDELYDRGDGHGVEGRLVAPMPGRVVALLATPGTLVTKNTPLLILEAMKMEHTISAPSDGRIESFRFAVGDQVTEGAELVDFIKSE